MELQSVISLLEAHMMSSERKSNGVPEAGVLIPFFERDGETYILLVLRSTSLRKHSGQISFPGGKIERQDQSILHTALRETEEEVGIPPDKINLHFKFHDFSTPYYESVTPIVASFSYPQQMTPSEEEIEEIIEVPLSYLMDKQIHHVEYWEYEGDTYTVHFFDFIKNSKKYNIWGATAGVIYQIISILRNNIEQS